MNKIDSHLTHPISGPKGDGQREGVVQANGEIIFVISCEEDCGKRCLRDGWPMCEIVSS